MRRETLRLSYTALHVQNALTSPEMLKEVERWSRGGGHALVLKEEGASTRHEMTFGSGTGSCSEPLICLSEASSHLALLIHIATYLYSRIIGIE